MVPASCVLGDALLLGGDDVAGQHRQHRAVHRHRHRHLVERDAVEEDLHVLDRVDRDAGLADVADDARVVAVVAAVGGEVEGHRQAHLPGGEVGPVEGVRFLGGGEAGVLADGPGPVRVHRGPDAAEERVEPGQRVDGLEAFEVVGGVERLDGDALGGVPTSSDVEVALQLLGGQLLPSRTVPDVRCHPCPKGYDPRSGQVSRTSRADGVSWPGESCSGGGGLLQCLAGARRRRRDRRCGCGRRAASRPS